MRGAEAQGEIVRGAEAQGEIVRGAEGAERGSSLRERAITRGGVVVPPHLELCRWDVGLEPRGAVDIVGRVCVLLFVLNPLVDLDLAHDANRIGRDQRLRRADGASDGERKAGGVDLRRVGGARAEADASACVNVGGAIVGDREGTRHVHHETVERRVNVGARYVGEGRDLLRWHGQRVALRYMHRHRVHARACAGSVWRIGVHAWVVTCARLMRRVILTP